MQRSGRGLVAGAATVLVTATLLMSAAGGALATPLPPDYGPSVASAAGAYYPAPAQRLLGTATTGYAAVPGHAARVTLAGLPGLPPSGLSAAVCNITVTAGSAAVAISAYPGAGPLSSGGATDGPAPDAPALSGAATSPSITATASSTFTTSTFATSTTAPARGTRTTLVTVPLDPAGGFDVRTTGGAAWVTIDLVGVYAADDTVVARLGTPGGYQPLDPVRLLGRSDTATGSSATAAAGAATGLPTSAPTIDPSLGAVVPAGATVRLGVDLGSSTAHVTALAVRASVRTPTVGGTVDVTAGAAPALVTLGSGDGDVDGPPSLPVPSVPFVSSVPTPTPAAMRAYATPTLSFSPGVAVSNLAFVPAVLAGDGLLDLEVRNASSQPADVRLDLVGFYDDGQLGPNLRFRALVPTRVIDTASGLGAHALTLGGQSTLSPPSTVAGDDTFALIGTATVRTTGLGADLAFWASSASRPTAGSVPVSAGSVLSVPVQPELGTDGRLELASDTGPADLTLDVVGSFESSPAVTDPTARGWVHAVPAWQISAVRR